MIPNIPKIGESFGRITIIGHAPKEPNKMRYVIGRCSCGTEKNFRLNHLQSGTTKSCGCFNKDNPPRTSHGLSKHPIYKAWKGMRSRCYNENTKSYKKWYGGNGITVCDEWNNSFMAFYDWSIENGWKPGLELDRHPNTKGNYEPNNCRWATELENNQNREISLNYLYNGQMIHATELAKIAGIKYETFIARIKAYGMSIEDAMSRPLYSHVSNSIKQTKSL